MSTTARSHRRRPVLFAAIAICSGVSAALWMVSLWSTTALGLMSTHICLSHGMLKICAGSVADYELQFHRVPLHFWVLPFEYPASLGLHLELVD